MIRLRNIILVIKDQMPWKRFWKNFFVTRNAWGLFYKQHSHIRSNTQKAKVAYSSKASAEKAANSMMKKKPGTHFSNYKCLWCDGYHVGKNR